MKAVEGFAAVLVLTTLMLLSFWLHKVGSEFGAGVLAGWGLLWFVFTFYELEKEIRKRRVRDED